MARLIRVVRTVRFLSDLRVMANMILASFFSLFWVMVLLSTFLYMFAVVLTQAATDFLDVVDSASAERAAAIREHFGSLFTTVYTLFQSITGGLNWGVAAEVISHTGLVYFYLFCAFVFFCTFSFLNIITGVFVENAIELARYDRHLLEEKDTQNREIFSHQVLTLLKEIDADRSGTITFAEFSEALSLKPVHKFMQALNIDTSEAAALFAVMDRDSSGHVDIWEFVDGMNRLRGEAKSFDIQLLMLRVDNIMKALESQGGHWKAPMTSAVPAANVG